MSEGNPLDRPATDNEIAEVERLLKATTAEIVPMRRPSAKVTTEVLALPMLPALPPMPGGARARAGGGGAAVSKADRAGLVAKEDRRPPCWIREGDQPVTPPKPRRGE
jgi:hypothetical protein